MTAGEPLKVGIVGAGFVGSASAYATILRGRAREIVLVDRNAERAAAEAEDLLHAVPFAQPVEVRAGDYADLTGSRLVLLAAGANQKPGETRLDLQAKNAAVFREVVPRIFDAAPDAVLVVATNPVDVLTHLSARIAAERGIPPGRVLGSGTMLDTARFRAILGRHLGIDPEHVHAYVLGEHGDSEVFVWSEVAIGGVPLEQYVKSFGVDLGTEVRARIEDEVRRAAYRIIAGKGATYYGVGAAISRIIRAVLGDQRSILTVCSPQSDVADVADVTLSLPHLVGGEGVIATLTPALDDAERQALRASARVLREAIDALG
jgi:L-lactate dehydrogenase